MLTLNVAASRAVSDPEQNPQQKKRCKKVLQPQKATATAAVTVSNGWHSRLREHVH